MALAGARGGLTQYWDITGLLSAGANITISGSGSLSDPFVITGSAGGGSIRVYTTASTATLTPEIDTYDAFTLTAQAAALNIANQVTSTPTDFQKIQIRILDNGTARAITFGTNYIASSDLPLPTTTVVSKVLEIGFEWDDVKEKWVMLSLSNNV